MPRSIRCPILSISLLAAAVACGGGSADPSIEGASTPPSSAAAGPAATAGADSVVVWAREIREGIAPLPGQVGSDPEGARQRAVELYVTRQERIEQTVGPGTGSAADLAASVHEAEARFHELMQLLAETPPPDSIRVAAAVEALDAGLAEVLDRLATADAGEAAR
ncbi:MAG TPA: hypothetical protein VIE68_08850 [Gemmatimonadota bacterium]|jgi:hypothetical protein